jgi:ankyrin repeat protein
MSSIEPSLTSCTTKSFLAACTAGDYETVKKMVTTKKIPTDTLNRGFCFSCEKGDPAIFKLFVDLPEITWFDDALDFACLGGHLGLAKRLIEKGATRFGRGFALACKKGSLEVMQLMMDKEADNFDDGLKAACEGGHLEIVRYVIKEGAKNLDKGMYNASYYGHLDIVVFLHGAIAKGGYDINLALFEAFMGGHEDIARFLMSAGADNYNEALRGACKEHKTNMISLLAGKQVSWDWGLAGACEGGHMDLVRMAIDNGATNWNRALVAACKGDQIGAAQAMIDKGANDWDAALDATASLRMQRFISGHWFAPGGSKVRSFENFERITKDLFLRHYRKQ